MPNTPREDEMHAAAEAAAAAFGVPLPLSAEQAHWLREMSPWLGAVPYPMHGGLVRYVLCGIKPGVFLFALLNNDLMSAVGRADPVNLAKLREYCAVLYCGVPGTCFGSAAKVVAWIARGGLAATAPSDAAEAAFA